MKPEVFRAILLKLQALIEKGWKPVFCQNRDGVRYLRFVLVEGRYCCPIEALAVDAGVYSEEGTVASPDLRQIKRLGPKIGLSGPDAVALARLSDLAGSIQGFNGLMNQFVPLTVIEVEN